jgi:hypothetical protein
MLTISSFFLKWYYFDFFYITKKLGWFKLTRVNSLDPWPNHCPWLTPGYIVFRLCLIQGPGFGLPGSNFFFYNQSDIVLVKKKSQQIAIGILIRSCRVNQVAELHQVFPFPIFPSTRAGFRPGLTCQAGPGFKTMPG